LFTARSEPFIVNDLRELETLSALRLERFTDTR